MLHAGQPRERYRCSQCGSAAVHAQGHKDRFLQTIPIGLKPTFICFKVARVACFNCMQTRQVKVPFADPRLINDNYKSPATTTTFPR